MTLTPSCRSGPLASLHQILGNDCRRGYSSAIRGSLCNGNATFLLALRVRVTFVSPCLICSSTGSSRIIGKICRSTSHEISQVLSCARFSVSGSGPDFSAVWTFLAWSSPSPSHCTVFSSPSGPKPSNCTHLHTRFSLPPPPSCKTPTCTPHQWYGVWRMSFRALFL